MKRLIPAYILLMMLTCTTMRAQHRLVVAADGSAAFSSVQAALDAISPGTTQPVEIFVKKGVYREVVIVDARKPPVRLIGEQKDSTILVFNNHAGTRLPNGDTLNTWTCASFLYMPATSVQKISVLPTMRASLRARR